MAQTLLKDNLTAPFTGSEICEIARITPRQLQWWGERGLVASVRTGYRRSFEPQEALAVLIIGDLRQKGFSLQKIRRVLRVFRREAGLVRRRPSPRSTAMVSGDGRKIGRSRKRSGNHHRNVQEFPPRDGAGPSRRTGGKSPRVRAKVPPEEARGDGRKSARAVPVAAVSSRSARAACRSSRRSKSRSAARRWRSRRKRSR